MGLVNITLNGMALQVPSNYTILEVARETGIKIPTLCFLKDLILKRVNLLTLLLRQVLEFF